jgi:hypothetical protein
MKGSDTLLAFDAVSSGQNLALTHKALPAEDVEAEPAGAIIQWLGCEDDKH